MQRVGWRQRTAHFALYVALLPDQQAPRLGVTVSREIGNAVVRNRVKRRLRESFRRTLRRLLMPSAALVVVARAGADSLTMPAVCAELSPALTNLVGKIEAR